MPGLAFLGLAAWLYVCVIKDAQEGGRDGGLLVAGAWVGVVVCGLLGLLSLGIFLGEFRYWINY